MENNELLFVASKLLAKDSKDNFEVGTHHVEGIVTLNVKAVVTREKDTESLPTSHMLCEDSFAQFIASLGAIQDSVLKKFEEFWQAKLTGAEPRQISKEQQAKIDAALGSWKRIKTSMPKVPKKGSTKVNGTVQLVSPVKEAA